MFEHLLSRAQTLAAHRRAAQVERLIADAPPPGITVTRSEEGVVLSGRGLRRRLITDAVLRSFGR